MTDCNDAAPWLSSLLDGELHESERAELDAHLAGCGDCRARLQALRGLGRDLRARQAIPAAPHSLRERVTSLAERPRRRAGRLRRMWSGKLWWAAGAAAVPAVALVWAIREADRRVPVERVFLDDHVEYVNRPDPFEVAGPDPAVVQRWFADLRVDFPVSPPQIRGTRLLGGRMCRLLDRPTALLFYEKAGVRLSLFVRSDADLEPARSRAVFRAGRRFDVCCEKGYCMLILRNAGLAYILIGALPDEELLTLAEHSL